MYCRVFYNESGRTIFMIKRIILVLVTVFFLFSMNAARSQNITFNRIGQEDITYKELTSGSRKVLFFWATWCYYCRKELKKLSRLYDELSEKNIELVAVNVGEGYSNVQRYKTKTNFPFSIALDKTLALANIYDVVGIPTFVYLSGGKEVAREHVFSVARSQEIFKTSAEKEAEAE